MTEAFEDLDTETIDAIVARVTDEQVRAFVSVLTETPTRANTIMIALHAYDWFPKNTRRDTQLRFMRTLRDAALLRGHPVCSVNAGLLLTHDAEVIRKAARRAEALARGAVVRARLLNAIADGTRIAFFEKSD